MSQRKIPTDIVLQNVNGGTTILKGGNMQHPADIKAMFQSNPEFMKMFDEIIKEKEAGK